MNSNANEFIYEKIVSYLKSYKRSTITLGELEKLASGDVEYTAFAKSIIKLIDNKILIGKNPQNNNGKEIPLPYKYGIDKYELRKDYIDKVEKYNLKLNKEIDLHEYFSLSEDTFKKDLTYIDKINEYIEKNGLPTDSVTPQERSFYIVGDEKWIDEKGGKKLLCRINLWDKLNIVGTSDPLMFAVNPKELSKSEYCHLIVENKATFIALLDSLKDTNFTSLIFGSGWKIVSNINMLELQLGLKGKHKLYYFGDLDNEGITIWNSLNEKITAYPAIDFYRELLKIPYSMGKAGQRENKQSLNKFNCFFEDDEKEKITSMLKCGGYLPQEGLTKEELKRIWRNSEWT